MGPQDSNSTTAQSSPTNSTQSQSSQSSTKDQKHASANVFANSGADLSFFDLIGSIKLEEFWTLHKRPCVRDALLAGITGGFLVGGGRAALGGSIQRAAIQKAANWAVGAMIGTSVGAYEFCQYRRRKEIEGMKRVVEIIDKKKAEKERWLKEAAEAKKVEEERLAEEKRRQEKWWKVW